MVTKFIPATAPAAATAGSALPKTIIAVQLQRHVPDPASAASRWSDRPVAPDPMKAMGSAAAAPARPVVAPVPETTETRPGGFSSPMRSADRRVVRRLSLARRGPLLRGMAGGAGSRGRRRAHRRRGGRRRDRRGVLRQRPDPARRRGRPARSRGESARRRGLVGVDNWQPLAISCRPPLTTVDLQLEEIGQVAAEELLGKASQRRPSGPDKWGVIYSRRLVRRSDDSRD